MTNREITTFIDENMNLIVVNAKGIAEAQQRAGKFLLACSTLAHYLMGIEISLAKLRTLYEIAFANAIDVAGGKTITEKKVNAIKNVDYANAKEKYEIIEAQRAWIKTNIKIFENAHILFRQLSNIG